MRRYLPFLALTTFTTLLVACSPAGSGDDAITIDDVVDTRDLLTADTDTSGALRIGEPAKYLTEAQKQVDNTNRHLRGVYELIESIVTTQPNRPWTEVDADPQTGEIRSYTFHVGDAPAPDEIDLEGAVAHEIGHLVGLGHSRRRTALMWAGQGSEWCWPAP